MNTLTKLVSSFIALTVLALAPIGLAHAQVKVTSADPAETLQGTVSLDVTVNGSGFNNSAAVRFLVAGTGDTGGVAVKKVTFKSSKQLIATIDVDVSATVNKFDIEVALSDGRKGKGTTLFSVKAAALDPCIGQTAAFVMSTSATNSTPVKDLYLLNAAATCRRYLTSLGSGNYQRYSSFRLLGTEGAQEGRIVTTDGLTALILIRFQIATDMQVDPESIIVQRIVDAPPNGYIDNGNFELSADGHRLAYVASHRSGSTTDRTQLRFIDDVDACVPLTPEAPACAYDVGTLLAEHVGLSYALTSPRWNTDGSWIYLEDRRGVFSSPYISRVSPQTPLAAGDEPDIVTGGASLRLFEVRSRGSEEVMILGEKPGTACRDIRVVSIATCGNGICGAQINSVSPRLLVGGSATLQSSESTYMTILTDGAKEDRKGTCAATGQIVRTTDSITTGVESTTLTNGWFPASR